MKALQVAVPEDNHRKLTTAVSGTLHNQGSNLEIDGLLTPGHTPNVTSRPMSKIKKDGRVSSTEALAQSKHSQELVSKPEAAENVQKSADTGQSQAMSSHGSGLSSLDKKDANNVENNNQSADLFVEKTAPSSD
ncbi:hypothetical protein CQW23_01317 [Capsicum baccatum]|uniref:Uncharacterized protein n=1 Tax=Capsicum baccatum TaxID=33114 RepID=A0A2G2XN84_CAPBA|nr:hypothetical protein CQW23_01317 [Capsicum baccatum]